MSQSESSFTSGQITIFLMSMIATGALFFYIGARFGAKIHRATDQALSGSLLPDEKMDQEIQKMLSQERQDLKFHQLLQSENPPAEILKTDPAFQTFDRTAVSQSSSLAEIMPPAPIKFRLQIGSSSDEAKIKADAVFWQKRGYPAKVVKTTIAGKGTWYRLQIGGYTTMDEVKAAQGEVMKRYGKSPVITPVMGE